MVQRPIDFIHKSSGKAIMRAPDVVRPESVAEASELLRLYGASAKLVSGSTAMTIMLRQKLIAPGELVSIGHLPGLDGVTVDETAVRLGGLVKHRAVECNAEVRAAIPVLAETFGKVASIRIRNAATVGGVLAEADYASDPPCVLAGLDATALCVSVDGERTVPVDELITAFYETSLAQDEVITQVTVPIPAPGTRAVYNKYVSRAAEDRPCVGVFASARDSDSGTVVRVSVGAAAEKPFRVREAEALAVGTGLTKRTITDIAEAYSESVDALEDMRGSAWYRREMVRVWVRRSLEEVANPTSRSHRDGRRI